MRSLALVAMLLGLASASARAEDWDPAEVAAAERLRAEAAARAADYRERVARGYVRSDAAPRARAAPDSGVREPGSAGDSLREAADLADLLERWFGGGPAREGDLDEPPHAERSAPPRSPDARPRDERTPAEEWWREEERRLGEGR